MNDLGAGHASLEYITHLEVEAPEVGRTFISGLGQALDAAELERMLGEEVFG